jgi:CDP-ribitol ribitolphosphotransferase
VRHHPFVRVGSAGLPPTGFVRDVSGHPDINELMLVADVLVTDYSSAIFEFSLLERPIAFLAPDLAAYEAERGFYVDYRSWVPGPVLESTADLAAWLRAGTADLERVRRFRDAAFAVADGRATERLVDEVLVPALG